MRLFCGEISRPALPPATSSTPPPDVSSQCCLPPNLGNMPSNREGILYSSGEERVVYLNDRKTQFRQKLGLEARE